MVRLFRITIIGFFILQLSAFGCKPQETNPKESTGSENTVIQNGLRKLTIDTIDIWVEIADTDEKRRKGLMWRDELPEDQGMLFVFPNPELQSFWMRNTYIPLDIAYIDENWIITDIHQMTPLNDSIQYESSRPVPYALEMNQGWFASHSITVGNKVSLQ
jgi:hypothetical protein